MKRILVLGFIVFGMIVLSGCENKEPLNTEPVTVHIVFDDKGGPDVSSITVSTEDMSIKLPAPQRDGYQFDGWYVTEEYSELFALEYLIQHDNTLVTLYAKWTPIDYTVTYMNSETSEGVMPTVFHIGSSITPATLSSTTTSYFTGWFESSTCDTPFDFTSMPGNDVTVYACWEERVFTYDTDALGQITLSGIIPDVLDSTLVIPDMIEGHEVIGISPMLFNGHAEITDLTLPNAIQSMPQGSLSFLPNIERLSIPFIGRYRYATTNMNQLGYLFYTGDITSGFDTQYMNDVVPSSLNTLVITDAKEIQDYALLDTSIDTLVLNDGLESIGEQAFCSSGFGSIHIPASVTSIAPSAFENMDLLAEITVDEENEVFSSSLSVPGLYSKDLTTLLVYPGGIKDTSFTIPTDVTKVGPYAFAGNVVLTTITIPNAVLELGEYAFYDTSSLNTVVFETNSQITEIPEGAFSRSGIVTIDIPDSVEVIKSYAFLAAEQLESVNFTSESNVTNIESDAFTRVISLDSIMIPASVTSIGEYAFRTIEGELTINCETAAKPDGWSDNWVVNSDIDTFVIVWGYTPS